jgi:hypothetical protein
VESNFSGYVYIVKLSKINMLQFFIHFSIHERCMLCLTKVVCSLAIGQIKLSTLYLLYNVTTRVLFTGLLYFTQETEEARI